MARRVLLVEDDPATAAGARRALAAAGYEVTVVASAALVIVALGRWSEAPYRYVLIDDLLPDGRGRDLVPMFHWTRPTAFVVLMSSVGGTERAIDALRHGSVLVPKPDCAEHWLELVKYLGACLGGAPAEPTPRVAVPRAMSFSALVLRPDGLATPHGLVKLRRAERVLLARLAAGRGQAVPNAQLRERQHHDGGTSALHTQIRNLRRALGRYAWLVQNCPGVGYRVMHDIIVVDPLVSSPPPPDTHDADPHAVSIPVALTEVSSARWRSTFNCTPSCAWTTTPPS